jgi:hypothetical protein
MEACMKRQTIRQRRALARAAEREAEAAAERAQKATHGNKRALLRTAVLARAKAMDAWKAAQ